MRTRRWLVVVGGAAVLVATGSFLLTREPTTPPPLDVRFGEIARVQAFPVPEGTPPPALVRSGEPNGGRPLATVRADIPSPFPAPVRCHYSGFGDGLQMSVWLRDGRRLDYFACAFPDELKSLYKDAWH